MAPLLTADRIAETYRRLGGAAALSHQRAGLPFLADGPDEWALIGAAMEAADAEWRDNPTAHSIARRAWRQGYTGMAHTLYLRGDELPFGY